MPAILQAQVQKFTAGEVTANDMFVSRLAWERGNQVEQLP